MSDTRKNTKRHYAERDVEPYINTFFEHVNAMTAEKLHDKGAIARELAWRDHLLEKKRAKVAELERERDALRERAEKAEAYIESLRYFHSVSVIPISPAVTQEAKAHLDRSLDAWLAAREAAKGEAR